VDCGSACETESRWNTFKVWRIDTTRLWGSVRTSRQRKTHVGGYAPVGTSRRGKKRAAWPDGSRGRIASKAHGLSERHDSRTHDISFSAMARTSCLVVSLECTLRELPPHRDQNLPKVRTPLQATTKSQGHSILIHLYTFFTFTVVSSCLSSCSPSKKKACLCYPCRRRSKNAHIPPFQAPRALTLPERPANFNPFRLGQAVQSAREVRAAPSGSELVSSVPRAAELQTPPDNWRERKHSKLKSGVQ
jgi:hypothetical protein